MERCPNCGAQIRSGARFCTTCGYRLSDADSAVSDTPATGTDAPSTYGKTDGTDTNATATIASADDAGQQPAPDSESPSAGESDATSESGGTWPTSWGSWPNNSEQSAEVTSDDPEGAAAAEPATASSQAPSSGVDQSSAATETTEPAPNDRDVIELGPADDATGPEAVADTAERRDQPAAPAAASDQASLDHAYALLDQLRELLPDLAAAKTNGDTAAIADDLAEAQSGGDAAQADKFARLRQTIVSAREQPRDIETALHLVGSLDAIAALQERYDQLSAAVGHAIERLRNQQGAS